MLVCDRCEKKLTYQEKRNADSSMTIYSAAGCYIGHCLDLCPDCKRLFDEYKNKMESYFMVNEDPIKILNNEIYWDSNKKYKR